MATFMRRQLAKLSETTQKRAAVTALARPEGTITLSEREESRYGKLFAMLDSDEDGHIGGAEGASFFRRSGLDTGACGGSVR